MPKLKIAIDFRFEDPRQGVGTAVLSLAHGLSRLDGADQDYIFLVYEHMVDWLSPHISGPCKVVAVPSPRHSKLGALKVAVGKLPLARTIWSLSRSTLSMLPASDGTVESLKCDVVHFPSPMAYTTKIPSIYQPWDLQHCHFPQFFSKDDVRMLELLYRGFCKQARFVCIQTEWGKRDLIAQYGIEPEKIEVIRWGSAFEAYTVPSETEIQQVKEELGLPSVYFVYPAVTWPHKNHESVIRSLAVMKQRNGAAVDVFFTGKTTDFRANLEKLAAALGVDDKVHFLGFVTPKQLQAIFHLAAAMIFPSKFEGLGLPLLEAFRAGLPVACSAATVLPEVAGDAAIFFDPDSHDDIATAMETLLHSPSLRSQLIARGRIALQKYSADATAQKFAELYERTARHALLDSKSGSN